MKRASLFLFVFWCFSLPSFAAIASSGTIVTNTVVVASATPAGVQKADSDNFSELRSALSGLNAKLEALTELQEALRQELEGVAQENKTQQKAISENSINRTNAEKIRNLELSSKLMSSEIAQIREDIGIIQSELKQRKLVLRQNWYHSTWFSLTSFGVACIALLVAL